MKSYISIILLVMLAFFISACSHTKLEHEMPMARESVLDYKTHIEDSLILDFPEIPRLCDDMDVEKRYVDIGDAKLYVEIEGTGNPMVLISGGPGDSHHIFHPWMSEASQDFQVIYYDQRGVGLSDYNPGEGYSFEQTIDDLEKLRIALKIDKWILVGHSFGGGIAQYYAIKYPERVIGQVLVGSVPMVNREEFRGGRGEKFYTEAESKKIAELRGMAISREISMPQYLINRDLNGGWKRGTYYKPSRDRIIQNALYDFVADPNYASDWAAYEFENVFTDCPVPTLIFEGKHDVVWEVDRPAVMGELHPNAKVVVFETSGHNMFADEPTRFVKEIKKWVAIAQAPSAAQLDKWTRSVHDIIGDQLILINSSKDFISMIRNDGVEVAVRYYLELKAQHPDRPLFFEAPMNALGYQFIFAEEVTEAAEVFRLNVLEFPESWNAYDSYGEALLSLGHKEEAINNYQRSVELNPENENGVNVLKDLIAE